MNVNGMTPRNAGLQQLKTMQTNAQAGPQAIDHQSWERPAERARNGHLLLKNLLFWGSMILSGAAIYLGTATLFS